MDVAKRYSLHQSTRPLHSRKIPNLFLVSSPLKKGQGAEVVVFINIAVADWAALATVYPGMSAVYGYTVYVLPGFLKLPV